MPSHPCATFDWIADDILAEYVWIDLSPEPINFNFVSRRRIRPNDGGITEVDHFQRSDCPEKRSLFRCNLRHLCCSILRHGCDCCRAFRFAHKVMRMAKVGVCLKLD